MRDLNSQIPHEPPLGQGVSSEGGSPGGCARHGLVWLAVSILLIAVMLLVTGLFFFAYRLVS